MEDVGEDAASPSLTKQLLKSCSFAHDERALTRRAACMRTYRAIQWPELKGRTDGRRDRFFASSNLTSLPD